MSSYLVDDRTIHAAVDAMFPRCGGRIVSCEEKDDLGKRLWDMNAKAVADRYREEPGENVPYRYELRNRSKMQMLKSAECLLYQCSEGDVPKLDLYCQLEKAIRELYAEIVHSLPEYNAASWGESR